MWGAWFSYLHSAGDWAIRGDTQGSQHAVRVSSFVPCYASSGYASSEIQLGYSPGTSIPSANRQVWRFRVGPFGSSVNTEVFPLSSLLALRFEVQGTATSVRWVYHHSDLTAAVQRRTAVAIQEPAQAMKRLELLAALRV